MAFWGCAAAVLFLSLTPAPPISVSTWDKVNHVFAFAVLGLLGLAGWPLRWRMVVIGLVAYGCGIEVLQSFTPTRQADWHDVLADLVGMMLGAALWAAAMQLRARQAGPPGP
jgi:VanZ family protein